MNSLVLRTAVGLVTAGCDAGYPTKEGLPCAWAYHRDPLLDLNRTLVPSLQLSLADPLAYLQRHEQTLGLNARNVLHIAPEVGLFSVPFLQHSAMGHDGGWCTVNVDWQITKRACRSKYEGARRCVCRPAPSNCSKCPFYSFDCGSIIDTGLEDLPWDMKHCCQGKAHSRWCES